MSKKILVIDDELDFTKMLKKNLESSGYEASIAFDGKEGLVKATVEQPDLILLDIKMPDMDGFEVLDKLKNSIETKHTSVIMLTARGETDAILKTEELGATDYIVKPFELSELLSLIKKYI